MGTKEKRMKRTKPAAKKDSLTAEVLAEASSTESLESFIESRPPADIKTGAIERAYATDPEFAMEWDKMTAHWLSEANVVCREIIVEIRRRILDPKSTLSEIVRALDVVSNRVMIHEGLPTGLIGHKHKHVHTVNAGALRPSEMSDEELDDKIKDINTHLSVGEGVGFIN